MAKPCTFELYLRNGDPFWYCQDVSTQRISEDVANNANEYWQNELDHDTSDDARLRVVFIDLCDNHATLAKAVSDAKMKHDIRKPKET